MAFAMVWPNVTTRSQTVAAVFGQLFGDDKGRALAPCYHSIAARSGSSGVGVGGGGVVS